MYIILKKNSLRTGMKKTQILFDMMLGERTIYGYRLAANWDRQKE